MGLEGWVRLSYGVGRGKEGELWGGVTENMGKHMKPGKLDGLFTIAS